jgi:hypothetical protein
VKKAVAAVAFCAVTSTEAVRNKATDARPLSRMVTQLVARLYRLNLDEYFAVVMPSNECCAGIAFGPLQWKLPYARLLYILRTKISAQARYMASQESYIHFASVAVKRS